MTDKITLTNLVNLQNENTAVNAINTNNAVIIAAFDNTISRDGTAPNQMQANFDMNSNEILNLPAPTSNFSPIRLIDAGTLGTGGTITVNPLPAGGTATQVLAKNSSTNFDTSWVNSIKAGGTAGQVLGKNSSSDGDVDWKNPIATGGTAGQILKKASSTNFDTAWTDVTTAVSAGTGITVSGTSPTVINVRDFISVKDFGAKGDGITDDAGAFRSAVAAATSGTTILIPPGRYLVNSVSNNAVIDLTGTAGNKSVSFKGMGWSIKNSGSYATPTGSVIVLGNSLTSSNNFIHYAGTDAVFGVSFKDFAIVTPSSAFGSSCSDIIYIDATASDNFYLDHFTMENLFICNSASGYSFKTKANGTSTSGGIAYATIHNNQMMNCWMERCGDSITFSSNTMGQNATADSRNIGIYFSNISGATSTRVLNNVFSNYSGCVICDGGVQPIIAGNEFETGAGSTNSLGSVVNLRGTTSTIYGAVIRDNSWAQLSAVANYPCLKMGDVGVCQSAIIDGNRFDQTTGNTHVVVGSSCLGTFIGPNYWSFAGGTNTYGPNVTNSGAYTSTQMTPSTIGLAGFSDGAVGNLSAPANASGLSWTLPTTSTALIGNASVDTLTNKTYDTAGTGNVFKVNGTQISAKTGTGSVVLATSPALVTPDLGTPTALVGTNITGTASSLTAGTATNATNSAITNDVATAGLVFPVWSASNSGNNALKVSSTKVGMTPSTGQMQHFSTAYLGSTSGTTVLQPLATASGTLTLPSATDQLVARNTTDTLTNKTLTSPTLTTPALGVATATSINGANIDNNAWSTYTPTITAFSGTITTSSATGRYKQIGKTIFLQVDITITTAGTGAGSLFASLPFTAAAFGNAGSCKEIVTTGKVGITFVSASDTKMSLIDTTNASYIANGARVVGTITYEIP